MKGENSLRKSNDNIVKITEILDFVAKDLIEVEKALILLLLSFNFQISNNHNYMKKILGTTYIAGERVYH